MIQNYTTVFKQDVAQAAIFVQDFKANPSKRLEVALIATQSLAILGLAYAGMLALSTLKGLVFKSLMGSVLTGAVAVIAYTLAHDLYIFSRNVREQSAQLCGSLSFTALIAEPGIAESKMAEGPESKIAEGVAEPVKVSSDQTSYRATAGTLLRPLLNKGINEFLKRQAESK